jgi:iron complex outermembrane receptor protein
MQHCFPLPTVVLQRAASAAVTSLVLAVALPAQADDAAPAPASVEIVGDRAARPDAAPIQPVEAGYTQHRVAADSLAGFGGAGGTQPYGMVSALPGVKSQPLDPYGMTSRIGGNKGLRLRGIAAWHGAIGTVDGLTLSNVNPGPGYLQMFDAENLAGVSLAQGPVPPDWPGLFTTAGALDSEIAWPAAATQGRAALAGGSHGFQRAFARVDLADSAGGPTRLALAASDTQADLWRGPGRSTRDNALAALSTRLAGVDLRLLAVHSRIAQHNLKPLTAAQAMDLGQYQRIGYDASPVAGAYQNYHGYNRQAFTDRALIGEAEYRSASGSRATVKAFWFDESGASWDAAGTNKVRQWLIAHDSHGLSAELATRLDTVDVTAGYSFTSLQPPGPPTAQKFYSAGAAGLGWTAATAGSSNQGWGTLSALTSRHEFHSLHLLASRQWGALKMDAGLRHVQEHMPSLAEHDKTGLGDLSYTAALAASRGVTVAVQGPTVRSWLPFAALRHALAPGVQARLAVGRNLGAPSFDIWNSNIKNLKPAQQALAQSLWNSLRPETHDAVDLGLRLALAQGWVEPTLYHAKIHDKSVNVYDPTVAMSYGQNIGQGHLTGAQLAAGWQPLRPLTLYGSASWTEAVFDQDLRTTAATVVPAKGRQFPDTPRGSATLGARWQAGAFSLGSLLRYQGSRYDDSLHSHRFGGYATLDLQLGLQWRLGATPLALDLSVQNLADRRTVGLIDVNELQTGNSSFYPGAPRSVVARLSAGF